MAEQRFSQSHVGRISKIAKHAFQLLGEPPDLGFIRRSAMS